MANAGVLAGQFRASRKANNNDPLAADEQRDNRLRAVSGAGVKSVGMAGVRKTAAKKIAKPTNGAKMATNRLLSASWLSLIPSFGLTLIWINIHAFMHMLFPNVFGKLGEEWLPGQAQAGGADKSIESANKTVGIIETMGLVFLDFLFILIILGAIAILIALLDAVFGILGYIFDWFMSGEKIYEMDPGMTTAA